MTDDSKVLLDKNQLKIIETPNIIQVISIQVTVLKKKKKKVATKLISLYKTVTEHGVKRYAIILSVPERQYRQTLQIDYN